MGVYTAVHEGSQAGWQACKSTFQLPFAAKITPAQHLYVPWSHFLNGQPWHYPATTSDA